MSFLAKLRTTENANDHSLEYCVTAQGDQWVLTLAVVQRGFSGCEERKPYTLQRAHLSHPPNFLTAEDVASLTELLAADPLWASVTAHHVLPNPAGQWLESIARRGRLYWQYAGVEQRQLSIGSPRAALWRWRTDALGTQHFEPYCHSEEFKVTIGKDFFVLNRKTNILHQVAATDTPFFLHSLPAEEVAEFIRANKTLFTANHWPLPEVIPVTEAEGEYTAVLVAQSKNVRSALSHCLSLNIRFENAHFCCVIPPHELTDAAIYALGELQTFKLPAHLIALHSALKQEFETIGLACKDDVWTITNKRQWRSSCAELIACLDRHSVTLVFLPNFAFQFFLAKNLTLDVNKKEDQLQLDVVADVNGEQLSLRDVLAHLPNLPGFGEYLEWQQSDNKIVLLPRKTLSLIAEELGDWAARPAVGLSLNQEYRLHRLAQLLAGSANTSMADASEAAVKILAPPKHIAINSDIVKATLRPYQWLGVYWLLHLYECGFNGLLADDMGLGKTLQTLTFLSVLKQKNTLSGLALIVAPTSLLHNWQQEIERFSSNLKVGVVHGAGRKDFWRNPNAVNVAVTSYQSFVNDLPQWQHSAVQWLILDEAQAIKNPSTKARVALAELNCQHRVCLSGTPVENHLGELWSILDFLNPGVLGSFALFKQYYQKPVEQDGNDERFQQVLQRVSPLILRRTKSAVAKDLPPKMEILQNIELPEAQYNFYDQLKQNYWATLNEQLAKEDNSGKQHLMVLTALMKLRQACCDPKLLGELKVPSGKTEYCVNMLQELIAEGRSALVFSQFTGVLTLLAEALDALGIKYLTLTGKTRNRAALVEAFQAGEAPVFLISLKAGGTGLNLTQADTVIHFDPWWNPAAEAQASDRAHRIGQDKPVFVYKLIAQNTIEEKIAALQESKAVLSDAVNQTAETGAKQFALNVQQMMALWQA